MLFSTLWAYRTLVKDATGFTPFQLIYGMETILSIEWDIPSLKLVVELLHNTFVEEELLLYLACLDEYHQEVAMANETHKKHVKFQYDKNVHPRVLA